MTPSAERLQRAVRAGDGELVRKLVQDAPELARTRSRRGSSLALEAYEREFDELAEWLLEERQRVEGAYVLDVHEAASMGKPDALRRALTQDPLAFEESGPAGFKPLHRSAYRAHTGAARLLLEAGAEPNERSSNGARMTPLHSAVAGWTRFEDDERFAEALRLLVSAGADPTIAMEGGQTARSYAERNGLEGAVALFDSLDGAPRRDDRGL